MWIFLYRSVTFLENCLIVILFCFCRIETQVLHFNLVVTISIRNVMSYHQLEIASSNTEFSDF